MGLPDLGPDPLGPLLAHDAKGRLGLAATVRSWLERGQDLAETATALGLHPNTLRYRLRRAEELLGLDLRRDLTAAWEVWLRLQAQPQLCLSTTSTGS